MRRAELRGNPRESPAGQAGLGQGSLATPELLFTSPDGGRTPSFISQIPSEGKLHEYCKAYHQTGEV